MTSLAPLPRYSYLHAHHVKVDTGTHNRALNRFDTGYHLCLQFTLRCMCNGISSLTAEHQLGMLHAYRDTVTQQQHWMDVNAFSIAMMKQSAYPYGNVASQIRILQSLTVESQYDLSWHIH